MRDGARVARCVRGLNVVEVLTRYWPEVVSQALRWLIQQPGRLTWCAAPCFTEIWWSASGRRASSRGTSGEQLSLQVACRGEAAGMRAWS